MKKEMALLKPNKSTPYYRIWITNPIGSNFFYDKSVCVELGLTKEDLKELRGLLK